MAEQAPEIRNKKLLLISVALAVLVVVIYNVHIGQVRRAAQGKTVYLVQFRHDLAAGSKLTKSNTDLKQVPAWLMEGLGDVVVLYSDAEFQEKYQKDPLLVDVKVGQYLRHAHIRMEEADSPARRIEKGMVAHPLLLDPAFAPGELLRPGDYVNVTGEFEFGRLGRKFYPIINGVRVLTVGGRSAVDPMGTGSLDRDTGVRSFRSLSIQVSPEVSLKLFDLTERMTSPTVRVQTLSAQMGEGGFQRPENPQIEKRLEDLAVEHGLLPRPSTGSN